MRLHKFKRPYSMGIKKIFYRLQCSCCLKFAYFQSYISEITMILHVDIRRQYSVIFGIWTVLLDKYTTF